jgi:hypothetical protein
VLYGVNADVEAVCGEGETRNLGTDLAAGSLESKQGTELLWHGAPVAGVASLEGHVYSLVTV